MSDLAIYSITMFQGQRKTIPAAEYRGLTAAEIIASVAPPDGLCVLAEKKRAPHFITCSLKVAPYTSNTALRFPLGAQGKMRSSAHCTESAWWALDLDDITAEAKAGILKRLEGMTYCAYSTHSTGCEPGLVCARVLVFGDTALPSSHWTAAWHVINDTILDGMADPATAKLIQLASVWSAHPDRVAQSFRHVGRGKPLDAGRLLAMAPKSKSRPAQSIPQPTTPGQRTRYEAALQWMDAGDYSIWTAGMLSLKAAVELGALSDADGRALWLAWSASAPSERRSRNGQTQYDPEAMWDHGVTLTTEAQILVASLFARARDRAIEVVKAELPGPLSERGMQAARYLRDHHRKHFDQLRGKAA